MHFTGLAAAAVAQASHDLLDAIDVEVHALVVVRDVFGAVAPWAVVPLHRPAAAAPVLHLPAEHEVEGGAALLQRDGQRHLGAARVQVQAAGGAVVVEPAHGAVAGVAEDGVTAGGGDVAEHHVALHQRVLQRGCREGAVRVEDEVAGGVPRAFAGLPAAFTVEDGRGVAVAVKDQRQGAPRPQAGVGDLSSSHDSSS